MGRIRNVVNYICDYNGCDRAVSKVYTYKISDKYEVIRLCFNHAYTAVKEDFLYNGKLSTRLVVDKDGNKCDYKITNQFDSKKRAKQVSNKYNRRIN